MQTAAFLHIIPFRSYVAHGAKAFGYIARHGKIPHRALLRPGLDMLHFYGVQFGAKHIGMRDELFSDGRFHIYCF
jgi:hypothetical protein